MVNKTSGSRFEQELCELLAQNGFWAHNLAQNQAGQPADVIAVKGGIAALIDCKVCTNDRFRLSRIEENQEAAMTLWRACGNRECWFALKLSQGDIYMLPSDAMLDLKFSHIPALSHDGIRLFPTFERWVEGYA